MKIKGLLFLVLILPVFLFSQNKCLHFDRDDVDYVVIDELSLGADITFVGGEEITIEAWIFPTSIPDYVTIIARRDDNYNANFALRLKNGKLNFLLS